MRAETFKLRWFPPVLALALLGCATTPACRRDSGPPRVLLTGPGGETVPVRVEVVSRAENLERGLMYRRHLDPDAGMLFVYPVEGHRRFWMKNTYIALDMLFIADNRRIVGVVENAEPLTETGREVDAPSRFVLEVNAGFLKKHGVEAGSSVRFVNIPEL